MRRSEGRPTLVESPGHQPPEVAEDYAADDESAAPPVACPSIRGEETPIAILPSAPLGDLDGLAKSGEASGVYFINGTTRRQVADLQVLERYRFAWERVRDVSPGKLWRRPVVP